jgi:hypothetical protein
MRYAHYAPNHACLNFEEAQKFERAELVQREEAGGEKQAEEIGQNG